MKILILFSLTLIISCSNRKKVPDSLLENAINIATQYGSAKLDSFSVVTDNNGIVSIGDEMVRYVINPDNVFHAEIDENKGKDILVTIDSLHDPYLVPAWHLILTKDGNILKTAAIVRSDMRVLSIDDKIVSAEIPTHKPGSPLYYCSECRDTVKYKLSGGRFNSHE